jgi:hypothetical protein
MLRAFEDYVNKLPNRRFVEAVTNGGDIQDLFAFAMSNTAMEGSVIRTQLDTIFTAGGAPNAFDAPYPDEPLYLQVKTIYSAVQHTIKTVDSGNGFRVDVDGGARVSSSTYHTLHGITFNVSVAFSLRRNETPIGVSTTFEESVAQEPYSNAKIAPPSASTAEYEVGAVFHILHSSQRVLASTVRGGWGALRTGDGWNTHRPRHNEVVDKIMRANAQLQRMVDALSRQLAPYLVVGGSATTHVVPWALHRRVRSDGKDTEGTDLSCGVDRLLRSTVNTEPPDAAMEHDADDENDFVVFDAAQCALMDQFLRAREGDLLRVGNVGVLVQRLQLLKMFLKHFDDAYDHIEETMVRAFFKSVGPQRSSLFERGLNLDRMLYNLACFAYGNSGGEGLESCRDTFTACTLGLDLTFPDETTPTPLHAIARAGPLTPEHGHTIKFRGSGDVGIAVEGAISQRIFCLPTQRSGASLPTLKLVGGSLFGQPVLVSIGAMVGCASTGTALFLLGDGVHFKYALQVAALPSNQAFESSLALLPPEMRAFARSIREADLGEAGLCIDVIEVRPLLASQLCIDEAELKGSRRFEQLLLNLVKAGASLAAIASETKDLAGIMKEVNDFAEDVLHQGELDQERHAKHLKTDEQEREARETDCYRSLSGGGSVYRSLGASSSCVAPRSCSMAGGEAAPGAGNKDDAMEEEHEDDAAEGEKKKTPSPGTADVMPRLLDALGQFFHQDVFSAAKITLGNPRSALEFAQSVMPDNFGNYVVAPHARDWHVGGETLDVNREALVDFLEKAAFASEYIKVQRIVYHGVFSHWERALLEDLMSGGKNPAAVMTNMHKTIRAVCSGA